jgi:hypothetical protein
MVGWIDGLLCVCVCVCVSERERERERAKYEEEEKKMIASDWLVIMICQGGGT